MLCGYLPFDGDDNQEIFQSIVECEPEFPDFLEDDSINLLIWLLDPEPKDRITIHEIKNHPFYLKGKYYYGIQYDESEDITEESDNNEMKNNFVNFNSDRKKIGFSTIRKNKGNIYTFNNIKRLKMKNNIRFKNNIYQNIFNNIVNLNEEEQNKNIKIKQSPYLLTSFNKQNVNESENNDKNNNTKIKQQNIVTEGNQNKSHKNNLINNNNMIQSKNEKKELSFIKANKCNSKSNEKKNDSNKKNENNSDVNKYNQYKSLDIKERKLNINHNKINNKLTNEKIKNIITSKNIEKANNIKDKLIPDQLDFFQKFLINKNKADSLEKSPIRSIGINCNLILTKNKEKNKDNLNVKEEINKNEEKEESSGKKNKNKISIKDRIILTQKRKIFDSIKKESKNIFGNKINIISSPAQNINNYYQRNQKKNKILNSIFDYNNNNKNDIKSLEVNSDKNNIGCRSCSIKKAHHRKNLKIDINQKLNKLKITNLNSQSNTIKKEERNNNFILNNHQEININNNLLSLNIILKTEPKNNHFLDKVIQKINSNKDRKSGKNKNNNVLLTLNNNKNKDNKQILRFLSQEKKNNNNYDYLGNPFFIKYYKNNENNDEKKSTIHLKEDPYILQTISQKVENSINRKSKDKGKKIFPNLMIFGKNKS